MRALRGILAMADVNKMAALMAKIPPNFFADFLLAEEEALLGECREEDDFIFISTTNIFLIGLWREFLNFLKQLCFIMAMFSRVISV